MAARSPKKPAVAPAPPKPAPPVPTLGVTCPEGLPWKLFTFQAARIAEVEQRLALHGAEYAGWCIEGKSTIAVDVKRGEEATRYHGTTLYKALAAAVLGECGEEIPWAQAA